MSVGGGHDWRRAPLSPFVAIVVHWEAVGAPGGPESLHGHSWMGWIARAPADWAGVAERVARLAPEGASARFGVSPDGRSCLDALAPVKPPGANAPWLSSEEMVFRDMASPRMPALMATWEIQCEIPSVWSDAWHERMTRVALAETMGPLGAELARMGFGLIEPLGIRAEITGEDHWTSVAVARAPGWAARAQAEELGGLLPAGMAKVARGGL